MRITVECDRCNWKSSFNGSPLGMMESAIAEAEKHYRSTKHRMATGGAGPDEDADGNDDDGWNAFVDIQKADGFRNLVNLIQTRHRHLAEQRAARRPRVAQCGSHQFIDDGTGSCTGCGGRMVSHWGHYAWLADQGTIEGMQPLIEEAMRLERGDPGSGIPLLAGWLKAAIRKGTVVADSTVQQMLEVSGGPQTP